MTFVILLVPWPWSGQRLPSALGLRPLAFCIRPLASTFGLMPRGCHDRRVAVPHCAATLLFILKVASKQIAQWRPAPVSGSGVQMSHAEPYSLCYMMPRGVITVGKRFSLHPAMPRLHLRVRRRLRVSFWAVVAGLWHSAFGLWPPAFRLRPGAVGISS